MNLHTATVPEVLREAADRLDAVFDTARRQPRAPAALLHCRPSEPIARRHRAGLLHRAHQRGGNRQQISRIELKIRTRPWRRGWDYPALAPARAA
jgi:hypothetical protein